MNNDLISREALKKALKSNCDVCNDKNTNWCEHCCPLNDFEDLIDNAPTVKALMTNEELKDFAKENFENGYEMAKAKYERPQKETTECSVGISEMTDGLFDKLMNGGVRELQECQANLRPKNEWIITNIGFARCPFCNCERQFPENYCGYCGADLRGEGET